MSPVLTAIVESLPIAVGLLLAAAPTVIIAVVLVMKRPAVVTWAFVGGWLLGLTVVGCVVIGVADSITLSDEPAWWASSAKMALGVLLGALAVRKWLARPRAGEYPEVPKWLTMMEAITPWKAFVLGLVSAAVNPKNLVIVVSGATVIADATPRPHEQLIALLIFVLVASIGIAAPGVATLVLGQRARPLLETADTWLIANNATIMSAVLAVLALILIGNGISDL
jgi:threonine/homoserine/homoserine lactone efflux protein